MNKRKIMTMLAAFALSVSALSTTAVFAEDAVVTGDTPAVTETTTVEYAQEVTLTTGAWTGENDIVLDVKANGGKVNFQEMYIYDANDMSNPAMGVEPKVELDAEGKGTLTLKKDVLENTKTYGDSPFPSIAIDWSKINKIELMLCVLTNTGIKMKYVFIPVEVKASTPTPTPTPSNNNTKTDSKDTTTKQETTTKKDYPKTGDQSNVVIYSSMLALSILAMICLRKKLA